MRRSAGHIQKVGHHVRPAILLDSGRAEVIALNRDVIIREQTAVQCEAGAAPENVRLQEHGGGPIGSASLEIGRVRIVAAH